MNKRTLISLFLVLLFAVSPLTLFSAAENDGTVTIVAFGDSIAAAGTWEAYFKELSGESVINAGVGGETSADALKRFSTAVSARKPDVVFIGFGTNDASIDMSRYVTLEQYYENMAKMVDDVIALGATPIIITPPPVVDKDYLTRHTEEPFKIYGGPNGLVALYAQTARNVAAEKQVVVADMYKAFSEVQFASLISDGVHPNNNGYKLYAQTALDAYRRAVKGDTDLDGDITAIDYAMIKRAILGNYDLSDIQSPRADVNGDGDIDAIDYTMIKRDVLGSFVIDRGIPTAQEITLPYPDDGNYLVTAALIANDRSAEAMAANTAELQACVDKVHAAGGGIVLLPAGTFYFSTQGMNARKYEDYVCMPKDNVTVIGTGVATVLMPVGDTTGGLDMFYFNEYADSGFKNPAYLVNADFKYFVIDGALAHSARYTSAGKGFMINLFKDCDFDNIICKNTDGTGFGVDCPINCTITNCQAYGCGKAATTSSYGASGFGIGTGYSNDESIIIDNCYSEGNMKFGFFFEHQGRFNPTYYTAVKASGCVVSNCVAKNNYNDFGGELAVDLKYINCTVPADSTSAMPIAFRQHSIRCYLENMNVEVEFSDVNDPDKYYYKPVYWAVNQGITTGSGDNVFGTDSNCTKAQAITFLYRAAGMPGELILGNGSEGTFYADALTWALKEGIVDTANGITDDCNRADFINMIWKYAGSPKVSGSYDSATNWAMSIGIMDTYSDSLILRRDAVTLLYRYFTAE